MRGKIQLLLIVFTCFSLLVATVNTHAQNGLIGDGFGTNDWSTIDAFTGSAGNSRIGTFNGNSSGNRYFRLVTNWSGNNNQWGPNSTTNDYQVTINSEVPSSEIIENSTTKAYYISVVNTSYFYVFKTKEGDNPPTNKGLIVFEVQGTIRTISGVAASSSTVYPGQSVTITATLDGALSTGQSVYLRYTNDDFSTSTVVEMTGSGTSYSSAIPAATNGASKTVKYYVFTSGNGLTISGATADWYTINLNNNGGSNYSYTVQSSWTTAANGNWSSATTWTPGSVPPDNQPITINHDVTLDQNATVSSITISSSKSLISQNGQSRVLTINSGGSFTNDGTFTANDGTVECTGTITINGSNSITFYNINLNGTSTFSTAPVISQTLNLKTGSSITGNSPSYGSSSLLKYSTSGSYNRNNEWTSATSGNGYPHNVQITNFTTLAMGSSEASCGGDLSISDGCRINTPTGILNVAGNISIGGTIELNGDVKTGGNWSIGTGASQINNNKAVFFNGNSGNQSIIHSSGGTVYFDYLVIDKLSGNLSIGNSTNIVINTTSGDILQILNTGALDLNGQTLTLNNDGGNIAINGDRNIISSVANGTLQISGSKSVVASSATLTTSSNVIISLSDGLNFGANTTTIMGTLRINLGGFVDTHAPYYGTGSILNYNSGSNPYNRLVEWVPGSMSGNVGYPYHVVVSGSTSIDVGGTTVPSSPLSMAGNLTIESGSGFYMDYAGHNMTTPVIIGGNVTIAGSLSLSGGYGGDIKLGGNWSRTGAFTPNDRAVFFTGPSGNQSITRTGGETFDYMIVDKTSGSVVLNDDITINDTITLTSGLVTTGYKRTVISPGAAIKSASAASYINGYLVQTFTNTGEKSFPIGKGGNYRPLKFSYTTLSGSSTVTASQYESAMTGTLPAGFNLIHNRYWNIHHTASGSFQYKVTLDGAVFSEGGNVKMLKKESGNITDHMATAIPHPFYVNTDAFSSLSDTNGFSLAIDCSTVIADPGDDMNICPSESAQLHAFNPSPGSGIWSVKSGPSLSSAQFNDVNSPDAIFTPNGGFGTYVLRWVVSYPSCPTDSAFLSVTVGPVEVFASQGTGVEAHACYPDLKTAFHWINQGLHRGSIQVQINGSTTETATARIEASGSPSGSDYSRVIVYPSQSGLTIASGFSGPLIELDDADHVIFDGREDTTGTTRSLTIQSTGNTAAANAFKLINGASDNIIRYCLIKSDSTALDQGAISFGAGLYTGNNNNLIFNNKITGNGNKRPVNAIYSEGLYYDNAQNTIESNDFENFFNLYKASNGIYLYDYNDQWEISSNSFYETDTLKPKSDVEYSAINISNTGTNYLVSGNFIGGSAPQCADTLVKKGTYNTPFVGISSKAKSSSIQGNTIKNIHWYNSANANWTGILNISGRARIGTITGNTIGAISGIGSIKLVNSTHSGYFIGIENTADTVVSISNNSIGAIITDNLPANSTHFIGISNTGTASTINIEQNTIGNPASIGFNSITAKSTSTSQRQSVWGISNTNDCNFIVNDNTISNMQNLSTNNSGSGFSTDTKTPNIFGVISESGRNSITRNLIFGLQNKSGKYVHYSSSVIGINIAFGETYLNIIADNVIHSLEFANNTEVNAHVIGIFFASSPDDNIIERNFIYNLTNQSIGTASTVNGIFFGSVGASTTKNNIITLEKSQNNPLLYGINISNGSHSLIYNTVALRGSGSGYQEACVNNFSGSTDSIINNIFANFCTGTGDHFTINNPPTSNFDYNNHFGNVSQFTPTANDVLVDPSFSNASGTSPADYKPQADGLLAIDIPTIPNDFFDSVRCLPSMGAIEALIPVEDPVEITVKTGPEPVCKSDLNNTVTEYTTQAAHTNGLRWSISNLSAGSIGELSGIMSWTNGFSGSVYIQVVALGCDGPSDTVKRLVVIHDPDCEITGISATTTDSAGIVFTGSPGMTGYSWSIHGNGTITSGTTEPTVTVTAGELCDSTFTLTLIVTDSYGCSSTCTKTVTVTDGTPPTFTAPGPFSFCVIDIQTAIYLDSVMDIEPERPEHYIFHAGDIDLNVNPATFSDNCCSSASLTLHWEIQFNGGTPAPISSTGQPSLYGTDIQFDGDKTEPYSDLTHKILYWLVDCNGNSSTLVERDIVIKPRPTIIKDP